MSKNANDPRSLSPGPDPAAEGPKGITPRPGQTLCGDLDMRIDRNGVWYYHGSPIGRKKLVRLFSTVLRRDDAGDYWLITPAELGRIEVEDAPFMAVELITTGDGADQIITFRTNVDTFVSADEDHPIRVDIDPDTGEPSPYVVMDGRLEARLTRSVYYDLVGLGTEEKIDAERSFGVWSGGAFFALGNPETAE